MAGFVPVLHVPEGRRNHRLSLMPSTHLSLHYHIVFSTKDRRPQIADEWCSRLHEYLGGLIRAADAVPECIGGVADHIHFLVGLKATHTLATFVQDIKQTSSRWIHESIGAKDFMWQQGPPSFQDGCIFAEYQPLCGWLISGVASRLQSCVGIW